MQINIKATGIELTPAISSYVEKKVSMLEKYLEPNPDILAQVEVGKDTQHHRTGDVFRAEIHIVGAGHDVYAVELEPDLYGAIDKVKDRIARELTSHKGKRFAMARKGGRMMKDVMRGIFRRR
jgi:putative sigma-54 modulation protein